MILEWLSIGMLVGLVLLCTLEVVVVVVVRGYKLVLEVVAGVVQGYK